jgi:multiple sugar transport system permease protein
MMRRRGGRRLATEILVIFTLIVAAGVTLFPVVWMAGTAFKPAGQYFTDPPTWVPLHPTFSHFASIPSFLVGYRSLLNSFVAATVATIISVAVGIMGGYGLARLREHGDRLAIWFLSQRMLPAIVMVIPLLLLIHAVHLLDTWPGLIIPYVGLNVPYATWMMRGFYNDLPAELEESALLDGCSRLSAFWKVVVPMVVPGALSTAVFVYIFCWSDFLIALFLTVRSAVTAGVELTAFSGGTSVFYGELSALSLVSALPILAVGFLAQRYLVRGLTLGAVKG